MKENNLVLFAIVVQYVVFQCEFENSLGEKGNFLLLLVDNIQANYNNLFARRYGSGYEGEVGRRVA